MMIEQLKTRAIELLAAGMKAEWGHIYAKRDRDGNVIELAPWEDWLQRAENAPASLRAVEAALTQADTREGVIEECAKVAELRRGVFGGEPTTANERLIVEHIASAIRALAAKPTAEELTAALAPPADLSDQIAIGPNGLPTDPVLRANGK